MTDILIYVGLILVSVSIGVLIGVLYRKKVAEAKIGSAEQEAVRILDDVRKEAERLKKEALVESKEEILKNKAEADREIKERRAEVFKLEKRAIQKEENLDRKMENLEKKEEVLAEKIRSNQAIEEELVSIREKELKTLEEYAGLTTEEAKAKLIEQIEADAKHDAAIRLVEIEQNLKDESEEKARNIISLAVQRCASNQISEVAVSVVPLPNDDMKGRIIGREGRNIRTIETLTGVDLIIDDTPEAITLSSFDPMRREVARLSIEKLIADGRIHPARIEEIVEKSKKEVEAIIKKEGENALIETGVHSINGELVRLLGRLKYRTSYGQNVLMHSIEVSHIAGMMADELGVDANMARRAGLLHDIGKALNHEVEGSHVQIGVDLAKKYRENREIIHAIEAHHGDVDPQTVIAVLVQAADAISAARPGARRENLENYIKRLEKLEEIATSFDGVEKSFAIQAGRELRLMVKPDVVNDESMALIARDIVKRIENELEYPGQIKVNVIRESRTVEYAK